MDEIQVQVIELEFVKRSPEGPFYVFLLRMPDLGRYKDLLPLDFTFFEYFGQRLSDLFFILVI